MEILSSGLQRRLRSLTVKGLSRLPAGAMAVLIVLATIVLPCHAAITDKSLEYGVKAAFLYKFSAYIEWPATAFVSPTSPFSLCLVDSNDQFNATLAKVVYGEKVNGRTVVVRQLNTLENEPGCHILYIGTSDPQRAAEAIEAARGSNTLTVCDNASLGIIDFLVADNHVRFNIDDAAAAQNGLVISSKLLSLAVSVKRRASKGEQ